MSRYYWWRRYRLKNKLQRKNAIKGVPFILQQIKHGDFDHSDYKRQADEELHRCEQELQAFISTYKGHDPKQDHKYLEIERAYRKRYNKLMEDYHWEEASMLVDLKGKLIKEFGVDVWDECMNESVKRDTEDLTSIYYLYDEIANNKLVN